MKQRFLPLVLLAALAAPSGFTQTQTNSPSADWKPATSNQPGND